MVPQTGDWVLGSSFGGIDTFYRPTGDGRYMAKVVGAFENISVFDQLAVVRETALYSTWAPLVPWSNALAHPNGFKERVVHWQQNLAVLTRYDLCPHAAVWACPQVPHHCVMCCGGCRDCLMRGYGCDYTERDMVLLCGEPVPDEGLPGLAFPPKPSKWLTGRMEISNFRAKITMTGPSSGKITMAAIIDPKASLPDSIVTLATKQIIGVLCYLIQKTARTMGSDALANKANKHLERIAQDPFYAHVAFPRWQAYLQTKGWGPVDHPELAHRGVSEDAAQQEEEQEMGLGDESLGLQMDEQSASSISLADTRMSSYSSLDDVPAPPLKRRTSSGSRLLRSMIKTASKTFKRKRSSLTSGPSALAPLAAAQGVSRQRPILREDQRLQTQPTPDSAAKELSKMEAEAQWEKDFMARWMPVVALLCLALTWLILGPMVGPIGEAGLLACGLHQLARLAKHSTATETVQGHSDGLDASVMLLLGSLLGSGAAYTLASCNMYTLVRRTDVAADAWVQWSTSGVRGVNGVLLLVGLAALLLHRRRAAATPAAVTIVSRR